MNACYIQVLCAGQSDLGPGKTSIVNERVDPRSSRYYRKAADYAIWNAVSALTEIFNIRPECAVHHGPKIRRRIDAVVELLNRNNVRLQTLKNPKRKRLITLGVAIEIG